MDHSRPAEVEALLTALEAADRAPLHPLVVIWVSSYCGKSALCSETETRILILLQISGQSISFGFAQEHKNEWVVLNVKVKASTRVYIIQQFSCWIE